MVERAPHAAGGAWAGALADALFGGLPRQVFRILGFSRSAVLFRPVVCGNAGCRGTGSDAPILQHDRAIPAACLSLAIRALLCKEAPVRLGALQGVTSAGNFCVRLVGR